MSKKLYYENSFLTDFDAVVTSCVQGKNGFLTVLDQTAFYPEGGGQPCDKGILTFGESVANIEDVHEKNEEITHLSDIEIPVGTAVHGKIDFERRFDLMQQHTGEHMFSGIVHSMFGYNNVGFHLSEKDVVVDFDGPMTQEDVDAVMWQCNSLVWADQPIIAEFPDNVSELEYRSKKELSGKIRIVTAGTADVCACCGTHTATTAQCGPIVATNFISYKGGVRINILCGKRAVEFLMQRNADCFAISHALSSPLEKITDAFKAKLAETEQLKAQLAAAQGQLMEFWARDAQAKDGVSVLSKENLSSAQLQSLALLLAKSCDTAVVFSLQGESGGKLCVVSAAVDTNKLGRYICSVLGGKGGGKPGIFQGFIEKDADTEKLYEIIEDFSKQ